LSASHRLSSIDALRGLVMIIMALDHTREYFHSGAMQFAALDLSKTTAAIFLTRWVTHFCAPTFFFTAGLGAYFWLQRPGRDKWQLSKYLATRGLMLAVLELTVYRFIIFFRMDAGPLLLTILWALGLAMIALAALVHIPVRVLAPLSLAVIALHNLADGVQLTGPAMILHQLGFFEIGGVGFVSVYPFVPWFAVMALGYCVGPIVGERALLAKIGAGMVVAFLVLRVVNVYGDPGPWDGTSFLSFLRTNKYPPSLQFLLMTLGPAMLMLAAFTGRKWPVLEIYGRVPLFYFLGHFLLIHLLTYPFAWVRYGEVGFLANPSPALGGPASSYPAGYGYTLLETYGVWALVVILMYPLCRWYGRRGKRDVPSGTRISLPA